RPWALQPLEQERGYRRRTGVEGCGAPLWGRGQALTASGRTPRVRRERRTIERPRLIKLLDESEAPIILLLAPAGYGKTTLARQWAKTLNGAVWVSLTPAHRDVARLAEDIAAGIDGLGG